MNAELHRRLEAREAPFDGLTVSSAPEVPAVFLRKTLASVVEVLRLDYDDAPLFTLTDSYAVDGLLATARTTRWDALAASLVADQRLFIACSDEEDVYTALFPSEYSFYLRFYMTPNIQPGCPLEGRFDVTVCAADAELFEARLRKRGLIAGDAALRCTAAAEYFGV